MIIVNKLIRIAEVPIILPFADCHVVTTLVSIKSFHQFFDKCPSLLVLTSHTLFCSFDEKIT
jgi:hypothetical protein